MEYSTPRSAFAVRLRFFALILVLGALGLMEGCSSGGSSSGNGGGSTGPTPAITSISPNKISAGSGALTLTVTGSGFVNTSVVEVGSTAEATTYVSSTQLTAIVPATQLTSGTEATVVVLNGSSSSGSGTPTNLEIDNPAPTIASVSPTSAMAGTASAVLTVTGTGFVPTTTINVNGSARATTYINATQVSAALSTADFAAAGTLSVTAVNSGPGGGTSAVSSFAVNDPAVGAIQLNPSVVYAGTSSPTTITVTGAIFVPASVVEVNGAARATTYVSATSLTFAATVADQAAAATLAVAVVNPAPGGGTSPATGLRIVQRPVTPVITSLSPTSLIVGGGASALTVNGTGFVSTSIVQWNGASLPTALQTYYNGTGTSTDLVATVPASDLTATGTATITVNTPAAIPSLSNAVTLNIANPPVPTLTQMYPNGGPINTASAVTLTGTGFTTNTTVALNGVTIPSTFGSSTQITATFPAANLALPGNVNVTVTTPAPGGGTSSALEYTTFISLPNNDLVYNSADGLLYASVPASTVGAIGNCVVGIDPYTGNIVRQIQVGSNPNKLALSTDGTQLFVGLDGSAAVAQVNLAQGKVVDQFSLGGGPGVYNAPYTAQYLAAVPGSPNSVAVASNGTGVTIYDSGVARANNLSSDGVGPLSFASSSSLYLAGSNVDALAVNASGISGSTALYSPSGYIGPTIQYDNGELYLSNGAVVNASTGALSGTFYSSAGVQANGPVVSDSTVGRAFIAATSFSSPNGIYVFDESTFNLIGSIPVNDLGSQGYPTSFRKIVRWGQNGIAVAAIPSSFTTNNQIFIFQTPLVKDLSSSPADASVSLTAPATATTGTAVSWVATVSNSGPNAAAGTALAINLDPSLIINSVTASQGTCNSGTSLACDLGSVASGATVTVTVSATPTAAGTLAGTANVTSASYDPALSNNQSTTNTTVTGSQYSAAPSISAISPDLVQAGAANFTLTVTGTGFNTASTVNLGSTALSTSYVSSTKLTATVTAAEIANYGWAAVTVSNPTPGGGVSSVAPLTIYELVNVTANAMVFDPYAQSLYATIPSTATGMTGDSVVSINPFTGAVGTPVAVGSEPTVMAETSDGNYLYIGLSGADSLAQFNLLTQSVGATIPLAYSSQKTPALSLAAMPGTDTTLAIGISNGWDQFGIFDVSGSTGSFRSNVSGIYEGINPVFASPTELYAYDSQTSGSEFYRYSINAGGLTLMDGTTLDGMGGFYGGFQLANGLVYGGGGGVANPSTTPPSQVATLPSVDFYGSGDAGYGAGVSADPSLQKDFVMLTNPAGTWAYGLTRYDLTTYLPEAVLNMPASASGVNTTWTMLRFGQDGLALLSYDNFGVTPAVSQMMLLRGPFVAPQELGTGTAAALTGSSATTITHGSGNTILTLTGSNFLPGVAVTWNGSYRTTTIVDATHVTVAIPASDVVNTGTASVVATNPGAAASNALQITIN